MHFHEKVLITGTLSYLSYEIIYKNCFLEFIKNNQHELDRNRLYLNLGKWQCDFFLFQEFDVKKLRCTWNYKKWLISKIMKIGLRTGNSPNLQIYVIYKNMYLFFYQLAEDCVSFCCCLEFSVILSLLYELM